MAGWSQRNSKPTHTDSTTFFRVTAVTVQDYRYYHGRLSEVGTFRHTILPSLSCSSSDNLSLSLMLSSSFSSPSLLASSSSSSDSISSSSSSASSSTNGFTYQIKKDTSLFIANNFAVNKCSTFIDSNSQIITFSRTKCRLSIFSVILLLKQIINI